MYKHVVEIAHSRGNLGLNLKHSFVYDHWSIDFQTDNMGEYWSIFSP